MTGTIGTDLVHPEHPAQGRRSRSRACAGRSHRRPVAAEARARCADRALARVRRPARRQGVRRRRSARPATPPPRAVRPVSGRTSTGCSARNTGTWRGSTIRRRLKSRTGPWTYEELNEWLNKPCSYAPGTRMAFAGINERQGARADVIALSARCRTTPYRCPRYSPTPHPPRPLAAAPAAAPAAPGAAPAAKPAPGAPAPAAPAAQPAPGAAKPTGGTQPGPEQGAAGAGTPAPAAKSP